MRSTSPAAPHVAGLAAFCLVGPTAVGKSEVALRLAEASGAEMVSVDSMQVYRRLDIGTSKPSAADRSRVPHHLIDVVELTEGFDAARFVTLAREAVCAIRARGRAPILCGGTGLYFKAFLQGLGEAPPADAGLRAELEARPLAELLAELAALDPAACQWIDRQNPRRVIRALEVCRLTGKPFSAQRADWGRAASEDGPGVWMVGLTRPPEDLRQRIDARVDDMFGRGLVSETRQLLGCGLRENQTARQALGYRQVIAYLEGARSLPETIELVKARTRRYAKRQLTWFRRQFAVRWVEVARDEAAAVTVEKILRLWPGTGKTS